MTVALFLTSWATCRKILTRIYIYVNRNALFPKTSCVLTEKNNTWWLWLQLIIALRRHKCSRHKYVYTLKKPPARREKKSNLIVTENHSVRKILWLLAAGQLPHNKFFLSEKQCFTPRSTWTKVETFFVIQLKRRSLERIAFRAFDSSTSCALMPSVAHRKFAGGWLQICAKIKK